MLPNPLISFGAVQESNLQPTDYEIRPPSFITSSKLRNYLKSLNIIKKWRDVAENNNFSVLSDFIVEGSGYKKAFRDRKAE